jgi:hypothetical protein
VGVGWGRSGYVEGGKVPVDMYVPRQAYMPIIKGDPSCNRVHAFYTEPEGLLVAMVPYACTVISQRVGVDISRDMGK